MDRRAWWATVHGVAELDTTERLTSPLSLTEYNWGDANVEGDLAKGGVTWRSDSGLQVSEMSSRGREFQ